MLAHGDLPQTGGHRPTLTVTVTLDDLETAPASAVLDLGGTLTPGALRRLCCDAAVVPVVLGGAGQPLDVGRATRTIPDGLRRRSPRAIAAVPSPAATGRRRGPRCTTWSSGSTAGRPRSTIW